jgi:glycosyltransferase involved in cell wall biosynthesis
VTQYQISVVMPFYNAEKFLDKSIQSIIHQSIFESIELIVIDDGSIDNSSKVADRYGERFDNIHVFHIQHKGVSNARNIGINNAHGKYIGFIDADDWIDSKYFEMLLDAAVLNNSDISATGFTINDDNGEVVRNEVTNAPERIITNDEAVKNFLIGSLDVHIVTKIFKRSVVTPFDMELHYGEDRLFTLNSLCAASKVVLVHGCFYHYYQNEHSAMQKPLTSKSFENLRVSEETIKIINEHFPKLLPYAKCEAINTKCRLYGDLIRQQKKMEFYAEYKEIQESIRKFPLLFEYKYASKKHFFALFLAKVAPKLYGRLRENTFLKYKK